MDTWARATPEDREALFNQTAVTPPFPLPRNVFWKSPAPWLNPVRHIRESLQSWPAPTK